MTRSEFIELIASYHRELSLEETELAVKSITEYISNSLEEGRRVEIRGFGSFSLRYRESRIGRNPRTGAHIVLPAKRVLHFKPGKALRVEVNSTLQRREFV